VDVAVDEIEATAMAVRVRDAITDQLAELRYEPTAKRIRAVLGEATAVDSTRAVLLWEPRRVVPTWAVPAEDLAAEMVSNGVAADVPEVSERPVLDPSVPFAAHTAVGASMDLRLGERTLRSAGYLLGDPAVDGYVALDYNLFDSWWEEDELSIGHPRDPYHRIDILPSSRRVRMELDGVVLADSTRPTLLFETMLPVRFYLPRKDVLVDLLPSDSRTTCAYKGHATYFTPIINGREMKDLAWTYQAPLPEGAPIRGLVAFLDERLDVVFDGQRRERLTTQ
jgi:uncharacterized protein (DUF427 family)